MWMLGDSHAGTHTAATFTPTTSGYYVFSATYTIDLTIQVYATCTSSGALGVNQPDYAEVNVTPYIALYNDNYGDGSTVPNADFNVFHYDTRDLACSGTVINSQITFDQTMTINTYAYLFSSCTYAPRAALDLQTFVVSTTPGIYAMGEYSTVGSSTVLSSVAIALG
jgi:hypothetical protein